MLRKIVCEDKRIITINGTNYDLSYILPNLIAMAIPTNGITKQWRNSKEEIAEFLEERHNQYMIYNLTEKSYSSSEFENRVQHVGFLDHHPPRFNHLIKVIDHIVTFLSEDPSNVACIHCRAGRGRTGLVCSCVLLGMEICHDPWEALEFFAGRRSKISKGSTSPPQLRYCNYFYYYLKYFGKENPYKPIPDYRVYLSHAELFHYTPNIFSREYSDVPQPMLYFAPLSHTESKPFLAKYSQKVTKFEEGHWKITFNNREIYCDQVIILTTQTKEKTTIVGRLLLNAFFINEKMVYSFGLDQIHDPTEGVNKNQYGLPKNFVMKLYFTPYPNGNKEEDVQLHNEFVKIFDDAHFDTMISNVPPPLPQKKSSAYSAPIQTNDVDVNTQIDYDSINVDDIDKLLDGSSSQPMNQQPTLLDILDDNNNFSNNSNFNENNSNHDNQQQQFDFTQMTQPTVPVKKEKALPPTPPKKPKQQVNFAPKTFTIKKDPSFL